VSQAPGDSAEAAQEQTVTTDPNTGEAVDVSQRRIDPYYQLMRLPGEDEEQFLSLRPFVPASGDDSRRQLTAFMTAISDPERYGELRVFEMPGTQVDGPTIANANMLSDPDVSQQVTLLDQQGSQITLGNMLLIPVDQSLMYIRPLYTEASSTQVPRLQRVIISYGNEIVIENTLREGLVELFGEAAPETQEEGPDDPDEGDEQPDPDPGTGPTDEPEEDDPEVPTGDEDVAELLAQADQALAEAEAALEAGDLGTYQDKVDEARDLVDRALGLSGGGTTTTTAQPSDSA
jgi:uncharacterized membrane protein (UPF0182 family)